MNGLDSKVSHSTTIQIYLGTIDTPTTICHTSGNDTQAHADYESEPISTNERNEISSVLLDSLENSKPSRAVIATGPDCYDCYFLAILARMRPTII